MQTLLENNSTPVITAFLLGLLTALSPCPLATNIAAIGFISKQIGSRKKILLNGLLYTLGRVLAYTLLGVVLIVILKQGLGLFGVQNTIGKWGEWLLSPLLLLIYSGGTEPANAVNPYAVEVMREVGVDISKHVPTNVEQNPQSSRRQTSDDKT